MISSNPSATLSRLHWGDQNTCIITISLKTHQNLGDAKKLSQSRGWCKGAQIFMMELTRSDAKCYWRQFVNVFSDK